MIDEELGSGDIRLEISYTNIENLKNFSHLFDKDINTMLNEALSQYFENEQKRLIEENQESESMMTNLDFDEFWDGVDI